MTDYSELKKLAEAATQGEWVRDKRKFGGVIYGGPVQHWVNGSGQSQLAMTTGADWMQGGETEANADFIAAANPAAILALIAENEALREEIAIDNKIIADRERLLSMFDCPDHGQCTPYAMEQIEELRKSAPSKEIIWCACGDGHAANSYGAGFMDANNGVCENCDAVMSREPKD